jgi:lysozyme
MLVNSVEELNGSNLFNMGIVENIIQYEEGFSRIPYLCSEGYVTIGYGTKLHTDKELDPSKFTLTVSEHVAMDLLKGELSKILANIIDDDYLYYIFKEQPPQVKAILMSMFYQMGHKGVKGFKKMWKYLEEGNYKEASLEMLDSKWAHEDSPNRARRHAEVVRYRSYGVYT